MIPAEPVDRFKIEYFVVLDESVMKCSATFYVLAKYSDIVPDNGEGALLVNHWLIDGFDRGRLIGWAAMAEHLKRDNVVMREVDGYAIALERARRRLASLVEQVSHQEAAVETLEAKWAALR